MSYHPEGKFDLLAFSDLLLQSHGSETNTHTEGPMGKLCMKYQIDSCQTFQDITWKRVSSNRQMDGRRMDSRAVSKHNMPDGHLKTNVSDN